MTPSDLLQSLQWRYATKEFDSSQKLSSEQWNALKESLVLTPSSYGLQPWLFHVVTSPELKKELRIHSWNQSQVEDCSHLVVFVYDKKVSEQEVSTYLNDIVSTRETSLESLDMLKGMLENHLKHHTPEQLEQWAKLQTYIALGQLMGASAAIGVDACPLEGITPAEYAQILKIDTDKYAVSVACALGFRSDSDKYATLGKVRYSSDKIVIEHS